MARNGERRPSLCQGQGACGGDSASAGSGVLQQNRRFGYTQDALYIATRKICFIKTHTERKKQNKTQKPLVFFPFILGFSHQWAGLCTTRATGSREEGDPIVQANPSPDTPSGPSQPEGLYSLLVFHKTPTMSEPLAQSALEPLLGRPTKH